MKGDVNILKQRIQYFFDNQLSVHISLNNTRFFNGKILEFSGDLLIIDDKELGATPVYLLEIRYIEPFKEVGK